MYETPIERTSNASTLLLADSLAKTSVPLDLALELVGPGADYGVRCAELLMSYDQSSRSWRTFQLCLFQSGQGGLHQSQECAETWPKLGMTVNGLCYQLVDLEPHICVRECSLWPTPTASDWKSWGSMENLRRWFSMSFQQRPQYRYAALFGKRPSWKLSAWLMGFPMTWVPSRVSAIRLSRTKPNG
jgi:hypothetical protein